MPSNNLWRILPPAIAILLVQSDTSHIIQISICTTSCFDDSNKVIKI